MVPEDPINQPLHTVYRYRPRTEGLFARIERWEHNTTRDVHWRTITRTTLLVFTRVARRHALRTPATRIAFMNGSCRNL